MQRNGCYGFKSLILLSQKSSVVTTVCIAILAVLAMPAVASAATHKKHVAKSSIPNQSTRV